MAEITKINIKGVDYDIGGSGGSVDIIHINVDFGDTSQYTNYQAEVEIVVGTNITQEDYNKLLVSGFHIIQLKYERNISTDIKNSSTIFCIFESNTDDFGTIGQADKLLTQYFGNVATDGEYKWLADLVIHFTHAPDYPEINGFGITLQGYKLQII